MSETAFTPEPWGVRGDNQRMVIVANEDIIATLAFYSRTEGTKLPYESNAALLAAAPELLTALADIIDNQPAHTFEYKRVSCYYCGSDAGDKEGPQPCVNPSCSSVKARAALAKAEGRPE